MGPEHVFCFPKRLVEVKLVIFSCSPQYAFCQPVHVHIKGWEEFREKFGAASVGD